MASILSNGSKPYDFIKEVDVYDIERNSWKTLNFVAEKEKLRIINPACVQINGKTILIFGGIVESEEQKADN